jgi:hypothetical protein
VTARLATVAVTCVACGHFDFARVPDAGEAIDAVDTVDAVDAVPAGDLLVYMPFDSNSFLREHVTGVDAMCASCPELSSRPGGGGAAYFAGSTSGPCLKLAALVEQPVQLTIAVWLMPQADVPGTAFSLPLNGKLTDENTFEIFYDAGSFGVYMNAGGTQVSTTAPLTWHHLAGVYDGTSFRVYVDGLNVSFQLGVAPLAYGSNDEIYLGCDVNFGALSNRLSGFVDDVRLYRRALTPAEITALAQ